MIRPLLLAALASLATIAGLAGSAPSLAADSATILDTLEVFDGRERLEKVTGSQKVGAKALEALKTTDVNQVLKQVPGVQIQQEDGLGLRPNIGLRGTYPHRSRKVVIMEDGILSGPAPYSAPAAYFTPSMTHTSNLEVFKGLAAVPFGPNSIGGAVNYISRAFPEKTRARAEFSGGSYGSFLGVAEGSVVKPSYSAMLTGSRAQTTGFKKLPNGADTGFRGHDVMLKAKTRAPGPEGELSFKAGYADELSNETYLGLTVGDFRADPYRRYGASAQDNMKWKHSTGEINYQRVLGDGTVKTSLYRHDFHRLWRRFNGFRDRSIDVNDLLHRPDVEKYVPYYRVLNGQEDTGTVGQGAQFAVVDNDRTFFSQGWQTELWQPLNTGVVEHSVTASVRLHQDQIRSNHTENYYASTDGVLAQTNRAPVLTALTRNTGFAKTVSVQDEVRWKRWFGQAAARYEHVAYRLQNDQANTVYHRAVDGFAPGAGIGYKLMPNWSLSSTVSRGLTLVGANASETEAPEKSVNYELSSLYQLEDWELQAEVAGFYNDYQNIKGTAAVGEGTTTSQVDQEFSGGKARIYGLEGRIAKTFRRWEWGFPVRANFTAMNAAFADFVDSRNPEWGVGTIRPGDPLPYVPRFQASLGLGTEFKKFRQEFLIQYTGQVFDQAVREGRGLVPAFGIVDWNSRYGLSKDSYVFAKVDNLLNKRYAVSWRPFGLRSGKPQSFMVGIEQIF